MKKLLFIAFISCFVAACGNKKAEQADQKANVEKSEASDLVYKLDDLLTIADQLVDKTVKVRGNVTHTCKHSGKRCFIVGEKGDVSMRVEAKGNIGGFNRELTGSDIEITGILKERRLTKEYIDQMEKETNEKAVKEDGSAESCQAELNNIASMRKWMKNHDKDYYSIYYMDGQDYTAL
ncbi:hypothetical protein JGH11_08820 [Dysgonomonas sp. Marseille-P4677]|uniref:hypothetical protein n=1 Tax=Dysgonomonas sp. Marseille-P4677 TaxID=2364790 RepID=UPI0019131681|nr:hypothetical protein [Dysgonomonas sp. Marseille-P4677]MBK5720972.1 hypothetical protein [Dysgonomonas sp. Marseille-P4677]